MEGKALNSSKNEFLAICQPLKKMIPQLLLSLSIFSFVFSYSSWLHSPKFHCFSANTLQLLSLALNKNCLFLICIGLLIFLAKTSGLDRSPSGYDLNDALQNRTGDGLQISAFETKQLPLEEREAEEEKISDGPNEVFIAIDESEEGGGACDVEKDGAKTDSRKCWLFDIDGEEQLYGQQAEEQKEEEDDDDDDDDDDDGDEKEELNAEELKQKFEDFIRRMKEEIIINEARQKVVVAN